jgi:dihydroorotate dehydrogenase (NAD+) catalytic subunit
MPSEIPEAFVNKTIFAAAGMGASPIYPIIKTINASPVVFLGAKTKEELLFLKEFKELYRQGKIRELIVTTDDGSFGGGCSTIIDAMQDYLRGDNMGSFFINCGPPIVLEKAFELEKEFTDGENIITIPETVMKCGVGVCGSCADERGLLPCVDGPSRRGPYSKTSIRGKDGKRKYDN